MDRNSFYSRQHNQNLQQKANSCLIGNPEGSFSFSGVFSHSKKDHEKMRQILSEAVEKIYKIVKPSDEETISGMTINFFDPL